MDANPGSVEPFDWGNKDKTQPCARKFNYEMYFVALAILSVKRRPRYSVESIMMEHGDEDLREK